MDAEAIYLRLPVFAQNAICSLHGWRIQRSRYGPAFAEALRESEERLRWPANRATEYRDDHLRMFIRHAYNTTAYYRKVFDECKIDPDGIRSLKDMEQLPILTKADVQSHGEELRSSAVSKSECIGIHTSGTTGGGLRFATTARAVHLQWATWWRYWRLHGIERGMWCGFFGGRSVVPLSKKVPPFWRVNRPGRQVLFSGYHVSPTTLQDYVEELRRRRLPWLHGYPSILAMVAGMLIDRGVDLGYTPFCITTGAENLLPQQVTVIEQAFGIAPIQHYGMAEAVANASLCTKGKMHVDEDFAAVEFIPTADGSAHRVVGTNFTNPATPLIRYEVGDVVDLGDDSCDCGLPGRILRAVDGRKEDYVVLRNGARLGRMDHVFKDMTAIREAQLYQSEPGVIIVRIVRNSGYSESDERLLRSEFRKRVGEEAEIRPEYVDEIQRTASGKLRFVVSDIRDAHIVNEMPTSA